VAWEQEIKFVKETLCSSNNTFNTKEKVLLLLHAEHGRSPRRGLGDRDSKGVTPKSERKNKSTSFYQPSQILRRPVLLG
jgi:hypothetical protein